MKNGFAFQRQLKIRRTRGSLFSTLFAGSTLIGIIVLVVLIVDVLKDGIGWLDWQFITSYPSRKPEEAGLLSALFGTLWVMTFTALFSFVIGIGTAIYLEE
ncbi:MAG: phosphate ABC transporter, permease protein PstA, partial [Chloroflexi bacterium]|nr:phosphate ABC transporter, permease protein PstA [Chloroflexota bacterium]